MPSVAGRTSITATITGIERTAVRHLDAIPLSSMAGGPIAVRAGDRTMTPEGALYRVRLATNEKQPHQELTGTIQLDASASSLIGSLWRRVVSLLVREGSA